MFIGSVTSFANAIATFALLLMDSRVNQKQITEHNPTSVTFRSDSEVLVGLSINQGVPEIAMAGPYLQLPAF